MIFTSDILKINHKNKLIIKDLKNRLQNNKMTRPKFSQELRNKIYNKNNGRCFHCNCVLMEERWDVDHYPVVYADIEDQCRCFPFGDVTDPLDESNLQPSCVRCNRSHKYERKKCYYCGHSQLRIRKSYIKLFFINLITTGLGVIIGKYII